MKPNFDQFKPDIISKTAIPVTFETWFSIPWINHRNSSSVHNICWHVFGSELSGRGVCYLTTRELGHNLTALCMHKIDKLIQYFCCRLVFNHFRRTHIPNGQGLDKAALGWELHPANFASNYKNYDVKNRIQYSLFYFLTIVFYN